MLAAFKKERFIAAAGAVVAATLADLGEQVADLGRVFNTSQDSADTTLRAIMACPLLDGRIVRVDFKYPENLGQVGWPFDASILVEVPHGLGRKPLGWIVVRYLQSSIAQWGATIVDRQETNDHAEQTLILYASIVANASLYTGPGRTLSADVYVF